MADDEFELLDDEDEEGQTIALDEADLDGDEDMTLMIDEDEEDNLLAEDDEDLDATGDLEDEELVAAPTGRGTGVYTAMVIITFLMYVTALVVVLAEIKEYSDETQFLFGLYK